MRTPLYRCFIFLASKLTWRKCMSEFMLADQLCLGTFAKLRKATISFVMFVCSTARSHGTSQVLLDGLSQNLKFKHFFKTMPTKLDSRKNLTVMTSTLHDGTCTFMIISRSLLLRVRNVSDKSCRENQNTHLLLKNLFPKLVLFKR
jgi:hypothetical protein